MCVTFIHNKNNNHIFHTISNQYQFILELLPFSEQNLLNRKHSSLIYDILKTKEMSIFTDPSCVMIGNGCFRAEQFCTRYEFCSSLHTFFRIVYSYKVFVDITIDFIKLGDIDEQFFLNISV